MSATNHRHSQSLLQHCNFPEVSLKMDQFIPHAQPQKPELHLNLCSEVAERYGRQLLKRVCNLEIGLGD